MNGATKDVGGNNLFAVNATYSQGMCFKDWLRLNALSERDVFSAIGDVLEYCASIPEVHPFIEKPISVNFSVDRAWQYCSDVVSRSIPDLAGYSHYVLKNCTFQGQSIRSSLAVQPIVVDVGYGQVPLIQLRYGGFVADLISMVHEFSHAIQIVASQSENSCSEYSMGPIYRECCAFLAELMIIDDLKSFDMGLSLAAQDVWDRDSLRYFGADLHQLRLASRTLPSHYNYRWNYPIARFLSIDLWNNKKDCIYKLFCSGKNASDYLFERLDKDSSWMKTR